MNYNGERCVACGELFSADDDIVVCPQCGSPHHRECYKKDNVCANTVLHETGGKWKPSSFEEADSAKYDNVSEDENSPRAEVHSGYTGQEGGMNGGIPREGDLGTALAFIGFDPNEDIGGATVKEVSQFVGPNTLYYIPIFKRMKDFGTKISFNLSCLLLPPLYFANRRMWGWAILSAILMVILSTPDMMLIMAEQLGNSETYEAALNIVLNNKETLLELSEYMAMASWVASIVLCLFGNRIYYHYVMRSIKRIKTVCHDDESRSRSFMQNGGIRPINILIITIIMSAISLAMLYGAFRLLA